jgi:hypothetical protein
MTWGRVTIFFIRFFCLFIQQHSTEIGEKFPQHVSWSVWITSQLSAWDWFWQLKAQELETVCLACLASLCACLFNCLGILQNSVCWEAELFTISAIMSLILYCAGFFIGFSSCKVFISCSQFEKFCAFVGEELSITWVGNWVARASARRGLQTSCAYALIGRADCVGFYNFGM